MGEGADTRYRADIDGLRAIAVGMVIFYHLSPRLFPSGFVGVDLFFVISGYVVAASALSQLSGRWLADVLAFWMRRIRRIVPLLILVVIVGALLAGLLFPPFPLPSYHVNFRTGAAALVGLSNLYLIKAEANYFLIDTAQQNAFLHAWSLGVEEQYYILFALLMIPIPAMLKLGRLAAPYRLGVAMLIVFGALGLAALTGLSPLAKFYLPLTRIWEIGLGTLIALLGLGRSARMSLGLPNRVRYALRLAAAVGVTGLTFVPHQGQAYPSIQVLAAVALGALLIAVPPSEGVRWDPLRAVPAVYLGRISYGLYLWHWIIFFALDLTIGKDTRIGLVLALGAPLALSILSFRLMESPLRNRRQVTDLVVLGGVAVAFVCAMGLLVRLDRKPGVLFAGRNQDWTTAWMPADAMPYIANGRITKAACHIGGMGREAVPEACRSVAPPGSPSPRILSLGDSHSFSDWSMLAYAEQHGFAWSALSKDGCALPRPGIKTSLDCIDYWRKADGLIRSELAAGDIIYISTNWSGYPDASKADASLSHVADIARALHLRLVIKGPLPVFQRSTYLCTPEWYRTDYRGCSASRASELVRTRPVTQYLDSFASRYPNVAIFKPFDTLCPSATCLPFLDGQPLFRDANHLAAFGSSRLGPSFVEALAELLPAA